MRHHRANFAGICASIVRTMYTADRTVTGVTDEAAADAYDCRCVQSDHRLRLSVGPECTTAVT